MRGPFSNTMILYRTIDLQYKNKIKLLLNFDLRELMTLYHFCKPYTLWSKIL